MLWNEKTKRLNSRVCYVCHVHSLLVTILLFNAFFYILSSPSVFFYLLNKRNSGLRRSSTHRKRDTRLAGEREKNHVDHTVLETEKMDEKTELVCTERVFFPAAAKGFDIVITFFNCRSIHLPLKGTHLKPFFRRLRYDGSIISIRKGSLN